MWLLATGGLFMAIATSADTPIAQHPELVDEIDVDCVDVGEVMRWQVFSAYRLYIEGSEEDARYLLTTRSMCRGLLYTKRVEVPKSSGQLCKEKARIGYRDASQRRTCRIESIEWVPHFEEAARRVRAREEAEGE